MKYEEEYKLSNNKEEFMKLLLKNYKNIKQSTALRRFYDLRKQFEATVGDDRFKQLKKVVKREAPEVAAQLDYWFAHATNSIYGRKPVAARKTSAVLNPPKSASPSAPKSDKGMGRTAKALKELEARFKQTGSANDFANLRKLKMASSR